MDLKCFYKKIKDGSKLDKHIKEIARHIVFENQKIRIMPDAHDGRGAVVGFTSTIGDKIIPQMIGNDIGCGVGGYKLNLKVDELEEFLPKLEKIIREFVPTGKNYNRHHAEVIADNIYGGNAKVFIEKLKCYNSIREKEKIELGIGTMGSGNHFIEIGKDEEGYIWVFTHAGSRKLGAEINRYYYNLAVSCCQGKNLRREKQEELAQELKLQGREKEIQDKIIELRKKWDKKQFHFPKEMSYLMGKNARDYKHDVEIASKYAEYNRQEILDMVTLAVELVVRKEVDIIQKIDTSHNYIKKNIIRKGAIYAPKNKIVLIPLNMRDGVILAKGKGNADWNYSAPHGAGRLYSRGQAFKKFNSEEGMKQYEQSMNGIYTTSIVPSVIDESPMVYKPMEDILNRIQDTVDVIKIIKPILNIKDTVDNSFHMNK